MPRIYPEGIQKKREKMGGEIRGQKWVKKGQKTGHFLRSTFW